MKKIAYILAAFAVALASCNNEQKSTDTNTGNQQGEPFETSVNIRYVSQDSILKYYTYSDAITQANQKLQLDVLQYGNQLQAQANKLQEDFQNKLQSNGFLTQSAAEAEAKSIQQKVANYENLLNKRQADAQAQILNNMQALTDSINNYIVEYNATHKYDAILYREYVLYVNPALDITQEIIDGLNARYTPAVEQATADKK